MNTALLPNISRFARFFSLQSSGTETKVDFTELDLCPDRMATICDVHGCARFPDEAPLVLRTNDDRSFDGVKMRRFPNSWTAIASHERAGSLGRSKRSRFVAVRYCPECREAAEEWLTESLAC